MISTVIQQRIAVNFIMEIGKPVTETYLLLKNMCEYQWLLLVPLLEWTKFLINTGKNVENDFLFDCSTTSKNIVQKNNKFDSSSIRTSYGLSIMAT